MEKYVAIFSLPAAKMQEWMEKTDEATRKEQMDKLMSEWNAWKEAHAAQMVDDGLPLGKTKRVSKDGIADVKNDLNYLMIVQAENHEAAAELFKENPHLQMIPDSYVEVMGTSGPQGS